MVPSLVDCEPVSFYHNNDDDNNDNDTDDKNKDDEDDDGDGDDDDDADDYDGGDDDDDDDHLTVQSWQESACSSFTQWSTKPFPVFTIMIFTIMMTTIMMIMIGTWLRADHPAEDPATFVSNK